MIQYWSTTESNANHSLLREKENMRVDIDMDRGTGEGALGRLTFLKNKKICSFSLGVCPF